MDKLTRKAYEKVQDELFIEGVNFFQKWRQSVKNGVLPIGASSVGKTTLLARLDVAGIDLFMNFDRTTDIRIDTLRLRNELIKASNGVEHLKKIDVPGDLPKQWVQAYYDNDPRVLVIMVDDRNPTEHIIRLRDFIQNYKEGPSFWQKAKTVINFRWDNLSRILFVINKADKMDEPTMDKIQKQYNSMLAEIYALLNVNIQTFRTSLTDTDENLKPFFLAILDSLSRK